MSDIHSIGIIQGRLVPPTGGRIQSFPAERWEEEFPLAREIGFDCMELTIEEASIDFHPLRSPRGRNHLRRLSEDNGIALAGIVLDIVMEWPLAGNDPVLREKGRAVVSSLIEEAAAAGLPMLEIPMMGANSLAKSESLAPFSDALGGLLEQADRAGVDILLEVDTDPAATADFLARHPHPRLGINYDAGNSTWFGFDPVAEFQAYGQHIRNVHVKDCTKADYSVPLGTGETRFDLVMAGLSQAGYRGGFILQAARQPDDVAAARDYLAFVRSLLKSPH